MTFQKQIRTQNSGDVLFGQIRGFEAFYHKNSDSVANLELVRPWTKNCITSSRLQHSYRKLLWGYLLFTRQPFFTCFRFLTFCFALDAPLPLRLFIAE